MGLEAIKSFTIPLPPKQEQELIVKKLDALRNLINSEKKIIKSQIKTLKAYRKSLIHECVTGKKQVATIASKKKEKASV